MKKVFKKFFKYRFARLLAELLVVFIGVYAAFYMDAMREEEKKAKRLDQTYDLLIEEVLSVGFGMNMQRERFDREYHDPFMEGLKAVEKPLPKMYYSWYAALDAEGTEWQSVLEAGGLDALDNGLIESVRYYRQNMGAVVKFADLFAQNCIDHLGPNLEKGMDEFYDQEGNLRPKYGWYPFYLDRLKQAMEDLVQHAKRLEALLEEMKKGNPEE